MLPNRLEVQLRGASARLACGADVGSAAGRLVTSEYAVNGASCLRCPDVAKVQSIQTEVSLDEGLSFFILSGEEDSTLGQSAEQGKCWFEESGEIMSLPSPVRRSWNFRLNISKEPLNPALKTIYRKVTNNSLFMIMLKALKDATKLANENLETSQLTRKSLQDYYWQIRMKMNKCDEQKQEELSKMSETQKKTEGKAFKNGEKQESFSYLASEFEEIDIERINPITLMPQLSFTAELTNLSRCSL
ncbi:hypothetical protein J1605_021858 [Eschrichtius robustus]|uniref:DUF5523 domain-containing protein n=1 Tax=Eschrichtius robustus TaxID=9764 RepID=A0AB34HC39_ESCRO|nr:hypothetical protein J1605_021858 [Eschrichtius robustus]